MNRSDGVECEPLSVCHVVNTIRETSGPANRTVAVQEYTPIEAGLVGWFDEVGFADKELIQTHCVNAPDTTIGIDRPSVRRAITIISQYDVVHTHHPHSGTLAGLVARFLDIPIVYTYGTPSFRYTAKGRASIGLTNVFTDRITCVSPAVRDSLKRWERWAAGDGKIETVYTGVDAEEIRKAAEIPWSVRERTAVPESGLLIGHVGRLIDTKAQDILIESVAMAAEQLEEDVSLLIAGEGERQETLVQLAEDNGIAENVVFLGLLPREKVYKLMREVAVFAMPSKWEGFSRAAAEAMSLGAACVFSDIQAFREPYDGVAKFHPVGDSSELSEILVTLLSDPAMREKLGAAGQERVDQRFTIEQTAQEYTRIYREIS